MGGGGVLLGSLYPARGGWCLWTCLGRRIDGLWRTQHLRTEHLLQKPPLISHFRLQTISVCNAPHPSRFIRSLSTAWDGRVLRPDLGSASEAWGGEDGGGGDRSFPAKTILAA